MPVGLQPRAWMKRIVGSGMNAAHVRSKEAKNAEGGGSTTAKMRW